MPSGPFRLLLLKSEVSFSILAQGTNGLGKLLMLPEDSVHCVFAKSFSEVAWCSLKWPPLFPCPTFTRIFLCLCSPWCGLSGHCSRQCLPVQGLSRKGILVLRSFKGPALTVCHHPRCHLQTPGSFSLLFSQHCPVLSRGLVVLRSPSLQALRTPLPSLCLLTQRDLPAVGSVFLSGWFHVC